MMYIFFYGEINTIKYIYFFISIYFIGILNGIAYFHFIDSISPTRIKEYINKSNSLDELINNIKTKRYTYNKISRMLTHILFGHTKEDSQNKEINYNNFSFEFKIK